MNIKIHERNKLISLEQKDWNTLEDAYASFRFYSREIEGIMDKIKKVYDKYPDVDWGSMPEKHAELEKVFSDYKKLANSFGDSGLASL